jgi:hypothetical protein
MHIVKEKGGEHSCRVNKDGQIQQKRNKSNCMILEFFAMVTIAPCI